MRPSRTLGVLGGMGPAATAEFLRLLAEHAPASTDQQHPRIVMLSDPAIPDRTAAIVGGGATPLPPIRDGLLTLQRWGADLLAVPCNTAHVFIDRIAADLTVPVVHIVDATLREAMRDGAHGGWLAATAGTVAGGLYQRRAAELGYRLRLPDAAAQDAIGRVVAQVKAGRTDEAGALLGGTLRGLWRRARVPVLAACTELPLAYTAGRLPPRLLVSSLNALAQACVRELYHPVPARPHPAPAPAPAAGPVLR